MKSKRRLGLALVWLAFLLVPLPLMVILNRGLIDSPQNLLVFDLGIFAYVWWLMLVLISTRPRWLVQIIGMPALYAIHGSVGVMALVAATIHRFAAFSMFPLIKQTGEIAWYLEIFLLAYAVLFLSGWLVDRWRFLRNFKYWLEHHHLNHQVTIWLHRLNLLAIALIWLHVHLIPRIGNVAGFRLVFDLYTAITLLIYAGSKLQLGHDFTWATVQENRDLGSSMQELVLKLDDPDRTFAAGDFYFLSVKHVQGVSSEAHPFSVASAPQNNPQEVRLMVHRLGDFTKQVVQIPSGTRVKLEGPFGMLDQELQEGQASPWILYGLGSGVAPLLSLAQQYAGKRQLHLIWSGAQTADPTYQALLADLQRQKVKVNTQLHRFDDQQLQALLNHDEIDHGQVIIVGSAAKILKVRKMLRGLGFKKSQLHDERLTL